MSDVRYGKAPGAVPGPKAWSDEEVRAWARRVCGRRLWRLCGLAMAVIRTQNENEVLTRLCENLALERDQLKRKLEGQD